MYDVLGVNWLVSMLCFAEEATDIVGRGDGVRVDSSASATSLAYSVDFAISCQDLILCVSTRTFEHRFGLTGPGAL